MKKTKIIIPALAMLLLSTAASVSGTVAWFSMNNAVTVNGMAVTTKVSSSLLIAETDDPANYGESIAQSRKGILEPVSTIDGETFFYTVDAKGDGDAKTDHYEAYSEEAVNEPSNALNDVYADKTHYDATFNSNYGFASPSLGVKYTQEEIDAATEGQAAYGKTTDDWKNEPNVCYGYIDYTFFIKGTSGKADQVLYMSKCNLLYNNAAITAGFAWRVGVFSQDLSTSTPGSLDLVSILRLEQSKNFNQRNVAVFKEADQDVSGLYTDANCTTAATGTAPAGGSTYYEKHSEDDPQAVKTASTLDEVENFDEPVQALTDLDANVNFKAKIVVRLWLEGEDVSCTNDTYALLTQSWTLGLEFQLGDAQTNNVDNGVALIGSVAA